jgi:SNF1-activating kinase 1
MHGKVKLARNLHTGENVAIKIVPRFSKKRRLGKVTAMAPQQDKTKREIAILKKIRHPNVVALLEIIDDPELKKIYMVLEHVELGEIVWRKKGPPHICQHERRRIEREMHGDTLSPEEEHYDEILERRHALKELKRAKMTLAYATDPWSFEHGVGDDSSAGSQSRVPSHGDFAMLDRAGHSMPSSLEASRATSRAPSRTHSVKSLGRLPEGVEAEIPSRDESEVETPNALASNPGSATGLEGTMYGAYVDDPTSFRGRSPSMADSIISHMSSVDYNPQTHDLFADDFSYVPCFTLEQARSTFRDTVLGLEYLHYQGVVHRDIKPANLLWTRDHRVKISDFGVSYFGRPIRDGEPDDTVSESEAKDFDDDLELARTVGTPAFFPPELCYTDVDREQPRVSEQIDVWALGVTLYCLVYARIPFLGEDEFIMFKKIATEDVYIPRKRLRPVDPSSHPDATSLYGRQNKEPYRDDSELLYEDVDNLLFDLIRRMFIKDPEKRIRLREIKRHPWVVQGVPDLHKWLDDTDPARPSSGKKIQVDEREMSHAVVPLTFLERVRSVAKKTVGKVMHPFVDRSDTRSSRRRAASSAASSSGDVTQAPPTPHARDREAWRRSILPEDYFPLVVEQSTNAKTPTSPAEAPPYDPLATVLAPDCVPHPTSDHASVDAPRRGSTPHAPSAPKSPYRHAHARSVGPAFVTSPIPSQSPLSPNDACDGGCDDTARTTRDLQGPSKDSSRARSLDPYLGDSDKHANPRVGLSLATASGSIQRSRAPRPMRSIDIISARAAGAGLPSPLLFSATAVAGYQHNHPNSDPNIHAAHRATLEVDERPQTAHRVENIPVARTPEPRVYNRSIPEPLARAKEQQQHHHRKQRLEYEESEQNLRTTPVLAPADCDSALVPGPASPDDKTFRSLPTRETPMSAVTSTSKSSPSAPVGDAVESPVAAPSELMSPMSCSQFSAKAPSDPMTAYQSDPSLPALLSGASSVSADLEGELLGRPGIVSTHPNLLETTDSLTPPALEKEPVSITADSTFDHTASVDSGIINVPVAVTADPSASSPRSAAVQEDAEDGDDSDSDEGLTMMSSRKKKKLLAEATPRRGTNTSSGSNETNKTVVRAQSTPSPTTAVAPIASSPEPELVP